ncbi:MAG: Uma2 family endonuclease [Alphaproteobacteria bacterium]|nr:Uma2 family endonuclease [Alphaproteobacteria bacterium]
MADTAALIPKLDAPAERRRFTSDDVMAMIRAEILEVGGPEELLDGDIWAYGEPRRWDFDDVLALIRAGILDEGGPEELLDGEIWVMAGEGDRHVDLKAWVNGRLNRGLPESITVACDSTMKFSPNHAPEPDFAIFPATLKPSQVKGPDVLLVIEIADTSRRRDLDIKGPKYREYGVREYWVVDLGARVTHVHRLDGDWPQEPPVPFDAPLQPALLPDLALRLAEAGV